MRVFKYIGTLIVSLFENLSTGKDKIRASHDF